MTIEVRQATAADAEGIARAHIASWKKAYAHLLPGAFLENLDETYERRLERWKEILSGGRGWNVTFVAVEGGRVLGFISAREDDDPGGTVPEITALYLDPTRWRSGIGTRLMEAMTGALAGAGYKQAKLWVFVDNPRARAFYGSTGWKPDGHTNEVNVADGSYPEMRYVRDL